MAEIRYTKGNILESKDDAVVNPVNCVGAMGAGLAKQFRDKYPRMFNDYRQICANGELQPGKLHLYQTSYNLIINFPTKIHFKDKSKPDFIFDGLVALKDIIQKEEIRSISIPPLGCGLGGLSTSLIFPMIEELLSDCDCKITVYEGQC